MWPGRGPRATGLSAQVDPALGWWGRGRGGVAAGAWPRRVDTGSGLLSLSPRAAQGTPSALPGVRLSAAGSALQALPLLLRLGPAGRLLRAPGRRGRRSRDPVTPRTCTPRTKTGQTSPRTWPVSLETSHNESPCIQSYFSETVQLRHGISSGAPAPTRGQHPTSIYPCTPNSSPMSSRSTPPSPEEDAPRGPMSMRSPSRTPPC